MINKITIKNCVVDQIHVSSQTSDITVSSDNVPSWTPNTLFLANFFDNLIAGNIHNDGLDIVKFQLRRNRVGSLDTRIIGEVDFNPSDPDTITFQDFTAGVGDFIYSIVPFSTAGQPGQASSVQIESDFAGVWIVDKNDNFTVGFDKQWGSKAIFEVDLKEKRIEIPTFSEYPSVFYLPGQYATFTLSTVIIPKDWSFDEWKKIIDKINSHVPLLVKSGSGDLYVCDIHSPFKSSWMIEGYRRNDPIQITLNCTEIMSYNDYMESGVI